VTGPLHGVRVVDFSAVVSGPLAAMWLADQGADVIKIEDTGTGDITRSAAAAPDLHGLAALYMNANRGKRALSVDVTSAAGREIVLDLCRRADVFIQNWRPGVVERLGLGYDDIAAVRPDIVYVSISGFGPDGPYTQRRVYDPIIQGLTGMVATQTNPEIPIPDLVRQVVCDKATSLTVAQAVCAALFARERGAGGQHIVVPMLDVALSFFFPDGFVADTLLDDAHAQQRPIPARIYRVAPTADGHIITFTASISEMHALFRALGHPEWVEDPRFATAEEFRKHREIAGPMIAAEIERTPTAALVKRLAEEQVPYAPVLAVDQVVDDPQIVHSGLLSVRDHPIAGRVREARHPVRYGTEIAELNPLAPTQGQHTDEILREVGRDDETIAALRTDGVVR
jgi:crotonobetainyl-CoA:carnitine CoA-transferase CaiB-like acyl-CoA transferase